MSATLTATTTAQGLETAKQLVQRVCRMFYDVKQAIVIDQLVRKEAMRDEELAGRVSMPNKDVTKIVVKLLEDQIISVHRRLELKEGAPKAQNRSYYYIDYSHATDVIKWRMFHIKQTIDVRLRNELDSQGFVCPLCKKKFTHLDAGMLMDPFKNVLACDVCGTEVINNENEDEVKGSRDRMQRYVEQTKTIVDLLKKMEEVVLPKFDVVKWLELNGPQGTTTLASSEDGSIVNGPAIKINLAGDDDEAREKEKRERDAEAKRQQNQLPDWIAKSTISGEAANAVSSGRREGDVAPESKPSAGDKQAVEDDGSPQKDIADDLDAYYASLANEAPPAQPSLDAASRSLPLSATASPIMSNGSPRSTPMAILGSLSGDDSIATPAADELEATLRMATDANANGKRSRDELELDTELAESRSTNGIDSKKARLDDVDGAPEAPAPVAPSAPVSERAEEGGDEDEEDFEEIEDGDDNPMIPIGDKLVPFLEVNEEMQAAMTPEEYTAYWEVFQRLG